MAQTEQYDVLVLGSGTGGKLIAWHMAQSGRRTASIERKWIGGACPNVACMPSKNEIASARVAYLLRHAAEYGWTISSGAIDMAVVRKRKREMVEAQVTKHLENYKASGAELIMGSGRFIAPRTIEVRLNDGGTRVLAGDQVFINVGTHAAIPNVPGLEAAKPLTNIEALELGYLPPHLVVLGGGYVGLELAQAYRRFGSRVTVLEQGPQLMGREDRDVAEEIQRILSCEGIEFLLNAEVAEVRGRSGEGLSLTLRTGSGERSIEGSDILVAAGRVPNTARIGLEEAGVALDERGYVRTNERLETNAAGVWALGECAGSPQFTHVSEDDFRIVIDNIAGGKRSTRDRLVPYCMFTDPPLAHVGLSEGEAERQNVAARVGRLPTSAVLRAQAIGEMQGLMKILVGANDDRILGFTMIGSEAGEVMAVVQTAMRWSALYAAPRRRSCPPDHGRGARLPSRQRASSQRATYYAANRRCNAEPLARATMSALGHKRTLASGSGRSALPPEADMLIVGINVCYVPVADIASANRQQYSINRFQKIEHCPEAATESARIAAVRSWLRSELG